MKPGSLDSSGDVEYYGLHFCSTIFSFWDIQLLGAFLGVILSRI